MCCSVCLNQSRYTSQCIWTWPTFFSLRIPASADLLPYHARPHAPVILNVVLSSSDCHIHSRFVLHMYVPFFQGVELVSSSCLGRIQQGYLEHVRSDRNGVCNTPMFSNISVWQFLHLRGGGQLWRRWLATRSQTNLVSVLWVYVHPGIPSS